MIRLLGCFRACSQDLRSGSNSRASKPWHTFGALRTSDRLAARMLRASSKGCGAVLEECKDLDANAWSSGLSEAAARARAAALRRCVDVVLQPILSAVEADVGKPGRGGEGGWESISLAELEAMSRAASLPATGFGMGSVSRGLRSLTRVMLSLWGASRAADATGELAAAFRAESTNRLVGMATVVLCRQVTQESRAVWASRLSEWSALVGALGLEGEGLLVTLNSLSKAVLLYLHNAAAHGEKRLAVKAFRHSVLATTVAVLKESSMMFDNTGPVKVFPLFRLEGSGGVEEGEGHGPRKEYFIALGRALVGAAQADSDIEGSPQPTPFVFVRSAGEYYLNLSLGDSQKSRELMWATGWVTAQAICNRATLGVRFPEILFQRLLEGNRFRLSMEVLDRFDPEAANTIRNVARLPDTEFQQMLELEECIGMTREQYIHHAMAVTLGVGGDTGWVFKCFEAGFWAVFSRELVGDLKISSSDLTEMVSGTSSSGEQDADLNIREVFRVVLDEELGGESGEETGNDAPAAPLAETLWGVVDSWSPELKRRFVLFVTGSERLPLPGTELLRVELPFVAFSLRDHHRMLGMLPQAHTCENILELPNYWEALLRTEHPEAEDASALSESQRAKLFQSLHKILDERLRLAIMNCDSYGLDEGINVNQADRQPLPATMSPSGSFPRQGRQLTPGEPDPSRPVLMPAGASHDGSVQPFAEPPVHRRRLAGELWASSRETSRTSRGSSGEQQQRPGRPPVFIGSLLEEASDATAIGDEMYLPQPVRPPLLRPIRHPSQTRLSATEVAAARDLSGSAPRGNLPNTQCQISERPPESKVPDLTLSNRSSRSSSSDPNHSQVAPGDLNLPGMMLEEKNDRDQQGPIQRGQRQLSATSRHGEDIMTIDDLIDDLGV